MNKTVKLFGLFLVCAMIAGVSSAHADFIIDDFDAPETIRFPVIDGYDPDPTLVETDDAGIMGGQRDLLLDVIGSSNLVSFSGEIGGSRLQFNGSSPGATAILQYDGQDVDIEGPPAELVNSEMLGGIDLTAYSSGFRLDLGSIDGGGVQTTGIEIEVHSGTIIATFADVIADSDMPIVYDVPFASFTNPSVFGDVTSIKFRFNPSGADDVDFRVDKISVVPEPSTLMLLATCAVGLVALRRKRRA